MDFIGGLNVIYYSKDQIEKELVNNPGLLNHKKFMELFSGYLVAGAMEKEYNTTFFAGFPLKAITKQDGIIKGPTLAELLKNVNLIAETDFDICIGNKENFFCRCQITRIPRKEQFDNTFNDLINTLKNKFQVQPDKSLCLIINVENKLEDISIDELDKFLKNKSVPYGFILLVGKANDGYGRFKCWPIFPTLREGLEYDIGVPL